MLGKLCEYFLDGKIELEELNQIMASNFDTWKMALFNYLPDDEQRFHVYLSHVSEKVITKSPEQQYLDDEVTLKEYEDLKFPERKKKRDLAAAGYPLPYTYGPCRICNAPNGVIKCNTCDNLVCVDCVHKNFLDPENTIGSFLLMHRIFCMKFGKIAPKMVRVVEEPMFVRVMRKTGRESALEEYRRQLELLKGFDMIQPQYFSNFTILLSCVSYYPIVCAFLIPLFFPVLF